MSNRKASSRRKKRQPTERRPISKAKNPTRKKRPVGRPALGAEYINTRVPKEMLIAIDDWRASQPDKPIRIEAVRRLVALALHPPKPSRRRSPDAALPPDLLARVDEWRRDGPATRSQAITHLVETALELYLAPAPGSLPAPERIHEQGELGKLSDAANIPIDVPRRPADTPDGSGRAEDTPKTANAPMEPPRPPRPPEND
jgi:hypothetical protein